MTSYPHKSARGRRRGKPDTRGDIVAAARSLFALNGFDHTSIRAIARHAGVDPALIHHYFSDKFELLLEATQITLDPRTLIKRLHNGDPRTLGMRLVATVLRAWQTPLAVVVMQVQRDHPQLLRDFAGVIASSITEAVIHHRGSNDAATVRCIALVETIIGGMLMTRFVAHMEPAVSLTPNEAIGMLGPLIQQVLDQSLQLSVLQQPQRTQ